MFATDVLGVTPWSRQAEILRAVAAHEKVAVRSGHKIGKSTSCAVLALWWFATRPRALVVMTSSTDEQVGKILWRELKRLYAPVRNRIGGEMHDSHRSGLIAPDGRAIFGISTNKTENMGGFSGADLLFIVDEASGVDEGIFDAIEGNRAGGARLVMFGNPTQMSGRFYDAFHDKAEFWHPVHVSSTETPNATGSGTPIAGLAERKYIDEKTKEYGGPGNPEWDIRIGGNFPTQGDSSVIGLGIVDAAVKDWRTPQFDDGPLEVGVDVARYGDDETVIQMRRGRMAFAPIVLRSMDTVEVATEVMKAVRAHRAPEPDITFMRSPSGREDRVRGHAEKVQIKVDVIGVGAGVADNLKRYGDEVEVVEVNVAESATDEKYFRLRDQLWFAVRDWLKEGGKMQQDAKLRAELIAPVYRIEPRGQLRVSSKDDIKARIKRSPDRADALALAVYSPPPRPMMRRTPAGNFWNR